MPHNLTNNCSVSLCLSFNPQFLNILCKVSSDVWTLINNISCHRFFAKDNSRLGYVKRDING
jgi:hypothetical protein